MKLNFILKDYPGTYKHGTHILCHYTRDLYLLKKSDQKWVKEFYRHSDWSMCHPKPLKSYLVDKYGRGFIFKWRKQVGMLSVYHPDPKILLFVRMVEL